MKMQSELLLTTALMLIVTVAPFSSQAEETSTTASVGDLWAAEHGGLNYWGEFDVGWRAYIQRPPKSATPWAVPPATTPANPDPNNRSKYEEYGALPPGLYAEWLRLGAMTKDGMYGGELTAENIGNNNQRYIVDVSKAGEQYFTFMWDQIPHLYSTSAQSIWNGVGTNNLTTSIPPINIGTGAALPANATSLMTAALAGRFNTIDIGIQRDKAAVGYRWTPDPNWDVRATYSNERRHGTQAAGVVLNGNAAPGQQLQVPRPVDDTTQNGKLTTQYFGPTPWGGHYNVNLGGGVSLFQNTWDSYTVQNPFAGTPSVAPNTSAAQFPAFGRVSLMPSNQAYNGVVTTGIDLPFKTRWNNTVQYTTMRQDDSFIPNTINSGLNGLITTNPFPTTTAALPALSLNGEINTLLVNTQLTTQITPDWKVSLKYRYYDLDNQTPELLMPMYTVEDGANATGNNRFGVSRRALAYSYTKQNASEEVQWRPTRWATVGTSFGWEGWDRSRRDVNITNEYIGKTYADFRILDAAVLRSSVQYSERRFDNYDPLSWYTYMFPTVTTGPINGAVSPPTNLYSPYQRQFDMANRDRKRANVSLDWTPVGPLTITPSVGARYDDYRLNLAAGEVGLTKDHNWNAGIEGTLVLSPGNAITVAYMHEISDRDMFATTTAQAMVVAGTLTPAPLALRNGFFSNMNEKVDTIIVAGNFDIVPSVLDLKLSYTYSHGTEDWTQTAANSPGFATPLCTFTGAVAQANTCNAFPRTITDFQRIDATLRHTVDPQIVSQLGWTGEVFVKLRYAWDRNSVTNWQQDLMSPYLYMSDPNYARMIEMGNVNPNYNAHRVQLSLAAKW